MTYDNHYNHIIIYNEHIFKQRAVLCIFFVKGANVRAQ